VTLDLSSTLSLLSAQAVLEKIHLLSGDYSNLCTECDNQKNKMASGDSAGNVLDAYESLCDVEKDMHDAWKKLNNLATLYANKYAVILETGAVPIFC